MAKSKPEYNCLRKLCIQIVGNKYFDGFIMVCILLNTIVLAMSWYGESASVTQFTTLANFVFMGIFTIEAFIKIVAMKCSYFKDSWNVFDFVVVVFTPIVIVISLFPQLGIDAKKQATLLRVLRMLRILRIVKKAEKL